MKKIRTTLRIVLALCFIAVILYSGYRMWDIQADYKDEAQLHDAVMEYKPEPADDIVNQSVIDLWEVYPDAVGWLTAPGTNIDYPFVQSNDNDYYLRRDINGSYALAGTLFMDYRCEKDFTSQNTVIYGHHMKNGSMFGTLKSFADKAFFDENGQGIIYLPFEALTLEFFAYLVIDPATETEIYNTELSGSYFDYVKLNARHYRDVDLTDGDRIVTLSTCAYEFENARMVLLSKITS